jgi:hypothetical protein
MVLGALLCKVVGGHGYEYHLGIAVYDCVIGEN